MTAPGRAADTTLDPSPHAGAGDNDDRYPWIAMAVVLIGTFMVILDSTIVNVALPQIGVALDRQDGIEWIVTSYLLAVGLAQPPTAWLADRFGRKQVFIAGLAVFTLGSFLVAMSPSLEIIVAARAVQGIGGGSLVPVGMALVYELFPPDRRGTAMGVWGIAAMAGPAFGPVIGGYLVTTVSWHWLFLVNVPLGVAGLVCSHRILRDTGYREHRPFDRVGMILVSAGLVVILLAFAQARDWGWGSPLTIGCLTFGAVMLILFSSWELKVEHPAIDIRIFKVSAFTVTMVIVAALVVTQYAIMVFLPIQLQTGRGLSALRVGTMMVPMAAAAAITFPLGGSLTDRIGPRLPVTVGSLLLAASAWILAQLSVDSSTLSIVVALMIMGLGFGFAMMPCAVTGMNALPGRFVAQASSVRQLNQRVAASFGIAVLATLAASRAAGLPELPAAGSADAATLYDAYATPLEIAAVLALVAAGIALFLPNREQNRAILDARTAEADAERDAAAVEM